MFPQLLTRALRPVDAGWAGGRAEGRTKPQGWIHGHPSRVRMGRGNDKKRARVRLLNFHFSRYHSQK